MWHYVYMKKPILIATFGFPGSGKTYFSERLSKRNSFMHLSSDRVRLMMFENPKYTKEEHRLVFRFMDYLAKEFLQHGVSVIYDANFNFRENRQRIRNLAKKVGAGYSLVWIKTDENKALKRTEKRALIKDSKKKQIYRPISKKNFEDLKNEMEMPTKSESFIEIDGHASFKDQEKSLFEQLK